MLNERGVEFTYREYTREPLSAAEIRAVLRKLKMSAADVLRKRDAKKVGLDLAGDEGDDVLIAHMAEHPTLLQRPIAVQGRRAELGRPAENILRLLD